MEDFGDSSVAHPHNDSSNSPSLKIPNSAEIEFGALDPTDIVKNVMRDYELLVMTSRDSEEQLMAVIKRQREEIASLKTGL
jgi:hypothetical protein